jgi:hypothetical protein
VQPITGRHGLLVAIAAAAVMATGCATGSAREVLIAETSKGTVFLQRIPDRSFQAAHPIKLEAGLMARVLRGVHVQDLRSPVQTTGSTRPKSTRAFSDDEIEFLAPLIASALAQAGWDQRVGFRLVRTPVPASSPPVSLAETAAGTLYAYGRSLHVTLITTGTERREVLFFPEAARRPDTYLRTGLLGEEPHLTVAVNYELLGKLPSAMLEGTGEEPPLASKSPRQPTDTTAKEAVPARDAELEALKAELRSLRERIAQQEAQIQSLKGEKQKPKKSGK